MILKLIYYYDYCYYYYYYSYNRFMAIVWDYPGESVPEETFTYSPIMLIIQPLSASSIYDDP